MRVLVIEDDAETSAYIARGLRESGHTVEAVADGKDGLFLAANSTFDLLIVDRMMPSLDGLAAVKSLRAMGLQTPILMLTAMGSVNDRVSGLQGGADDYLVKPFSFAELHARAEALARRPPLRAPEQTTLTVGDLELDRLRRSVRRGERPIDLKAREFQLLEFLMLNADRVVTRTMLLEHIWEFPFDPKTNIVETHVSRLRAKLDQMGEAPMIHTIRRAGYVLRAP
jgi:two-component system OmpR family response regulator